MNNRRLDREHSPLAVGHRSVHRTTRLDKMRQGFNRSGSRARKHSDLEKSSHAAVGRHKRGATKLLFRCPFFDAATYAYRRYLMVYLVSGALPPVLRDYPPSSLEPVFHLPSLLAVGITRPQVSHLIPQGNQSNSPASRSIYPPVPLPH